jgi:hypothetical protein
VLNLQSERPGDHAADIEEGQTPLILLVGSANFQDDIFGRSSVELNGACDQDRPQRAGWINFLIEGRARGLTQMTEEMTRLWQACSWTCRGPANGPAHDTAPAGMVWSGSRSRPPGQGRSVMQPQAVHGARSAISDVVSERDFVAGDHVGTITSTTLTSRCCSGMLLARE